MAPADTETWAFCPSCQRWYYCEGCDDDIAPPPVCPVCSAHPVAFETGAEQDASQSRVSPGGWEQDTDQTNVAGWLSLEE